jgi:hypothetical protein
LRGRRRTVVEVLFEKEVGEIRPDRNYPRVGKRYLKDDRADDWRNPCGGILQKPLPAGFGSHVVPDGCCCSVWAGRHRGIACRYAHCKRAHREQNHKRPPALDPRPVRVCRVQHSLSSTGVFKHIRGSVCEQACSATNVIWWATSTWMDARETSVARRESIHEFCRVRACP